MEDADENPKSHELLSICSIDSEEHVTLISSEEAGGCASTDDVWPTVDFCLVMIAFGTTTVESSNEVMAVVGNNRLAYSSFFDLLRFIGFNGGCGGEELFVLMLLLLLPLLVSVLAVFEELCVLDLGEGAALVITLEELPCKNRFASNVCLPFSVK